MQNIIKNPTNSCSSTDNIIVKAFVTYDGSLGDAVCVKIDMPCGSESITSVNRFIEQGELISFGLDAIYTRDNENYPRFSATILTSTSIVTESISSGYPGPLTIGT